ncbi:MAG: HAD-IA family hydrolase [Methylomicrobium sp.]
MNKRFELIVFDWDGTLINTIDWIVHCLQDAAFHCGLSIPSVADAKDIIGLSIDKAITRLFPDIEEPTRRRFIDYYSQTFFSKRLSRDDLFEGVFDMLLQLKADGYRLAVATGKGRNGLQAALTQTDTAHLFDLTRCADETASKPSPIMLNEIIETVGISSDRTLMVGDSIHDLQMARNAGVASAAVACGAHGLDILQRYGPAICLTETSQLLAYI